MVDPISAMAIAGSAFSALKKEFLLVEILSLWVVISVVGWVLYLT